MVAPKGRQSNLGGMPAPSRRPPLWVWFLVPLVIGAATRGLWAPDEPRRAEVAREVFESGHWLVLHLCGLPYPDKPPLAYWLMGALGWAAGWSVFAMRLAPIAATAWTAYLTARIARRWWGDTEATWAPVLLLSCVALALEGSRVQIDPLLLATTTAALERADRAAAGPREANRRAWVVGGWCGLGGLLKGPVAWVVVGAVLAAWRLGAPRAGARASGHARLLAVALAVGPVATWAGAAALQEPSVARELFFGQHAGRIANADAPHAGPLWKYFLDLPALLLPWTVPIVAGLWRAVGRGRARLDLGRARAGAWLIAVFAFFSLIPPKRGIYLLPLLPAAALLGARWLALLAAERRLPRALPVSGALVFGLPGLLGLALPFFLPESAWGLEAAPARAALWGVGALALSGAIASARARDVRTWSRRLALGWLAAGCAAALFVWPLLDPVRSLRASALRVAARPEHPSAIPCYDLHPEAFRFYGRVPAVRAESPAEVDRALEREQADFLAIVSSRAFLNWSDERRARYRVVDCGGSGRREHVVLAAHAAHSRP